jgi:hypothetical protein
VYPYSEVDLFADRVSLVVKLFQWWVDPSRTPPIATPAELDWLRAMRLAGIYHLAHDPDCAELRLYQKVFAAQAASCRRALAALADAGIPTMTFKTIELVHAIRSDGVPSVMGDCDVIVPADAIEHTRAVLRSAGYQQARYTRQPAILLPLAPEVIARMEEGHYELAPFLQLEPVELAQDELAFCRAQDYRQVCERGPRLRVVVKLDIHRAVASDLPADELFARRIPSRLGVGSTLSATDHVWTILARLYAEVARTGKRSLHELALICGYMGRAEPDWSIVIEVGHRHRIGRQLFYYLTFVNRIVGRVPSEVLGELWSIRPVNDLGWQLAPLFETSDCTALDGLFGEVR